MMPGSLKLVMNMKRSVMKSKSRSDRRRATFGILLIDCDGQEDELYDDGEVHDQKCRNEEFDLADVNLLTKGEDVGLFAFDDVDVFPLL